MALHAKKPMTSEPPPPAGLRRKILRLNPDVLLGLGKENGIRTVGSPVPADARVINRLIDERGDILLLVESAAFPGTPDSLPYPEMDGISFTRSE